jgi:hypothetical protein
MDQAYNHTLTYTSLTLNTRKDIIENFPKKRKKKKFVGM